VVATNAGGGARTVANGITLNSGAVATFDGGYFPVILNGAITGPGGVAQASSGTVALGGNNSYTGGTNLGGSGQLRLDSVNALGGSGTITFSGGTLMHTAANVADYSARFAVATGQAYKVNTNGQAVTWVSPLTAPAGLFKYGEGTLTLAGASTYTGGTNAQGGVIETALISDTGATPIGTFTSASSSYISFGGGTLRYTGATSVTTGRYMWNDQVSGTFEVTNAAATVAFTNTSGSLNKPFTKTGAGILTLADGIDGAGGSVTVAGGRLNLNGTNTYGGNTTVTAGTLSLATATLPNGGDVKLSTGTTLNLAFTGTDDIDQLFIDGVEMFKGTWGGTASAATNKTPLITGTGILNVLTGPTGGGSGGYDSWAATSGLTSANNAKTADPDGDGLNNLGEFAFDGVALSGKSTGKVVSKTATIDGVNYLTLTLPVRAGATFNEDMVSSAVDGVVYRVQGTLDLSAFTLDVVEITGADATAIQTDLPDLSSDGWTYRSFRSAESIGSESKQFLRATANEQ
jgi:autotransporter-associated beta strand protein